VLAYEVLHLPADEEVRIQLAHELEQSHNSFYKAREMPGVMFQSRPQSMQKLVDAGVVDAISARRVLGI
jgi:cell division FtsZ-interacting protein ZapD